MRQLHFFYTLFPNKLLTAYNHADIYVSRFTRTRGGIGRHVRFRFLFRKEWGFNSLRVHQLQQGNGQPRPSARSSSGQCPSSGWFFDRNGTG